MKPTRPSASRLCLAVSALFVVSAANAQTVRRPDAGSLLQQIEKEQKFELPERVEPLKEPLPKELKEVPGLTVLIKSFALAGNTIYDTEVLLGLINDYVGKTAGFSDLVRATDIIAEHYRKDGWVVRVYLPQQDITEGDIKIQIVEAVFGGIRLDTEPSTRIELSKVRKIIEAQQPVGQLLRNDTIDRGLLLADDLPGVAVAGALTTGDRDGETALALSVADEPLARVSLSGDNAGSRSTGSDRVTASMSLASPFGYGDQVNATAAHTKGSDYLRLAYSAPVGSNGLRIEAHASYLNYKLVESEFEDLLKGNSKTVGVELRYPLLRARLYNVYLQGGYDEKRFVNEGRPVKEDPFDTRNRYKIEVANLGVVGNIFDSFAGGGANSFNFFYSNGEPKASKEYDEQNIGSFRKFRYGLSRQQVITQTVSFTLGLSGQYSNDQLDSSERFSLGGVSGVRAYPSGEATGTVGQLVNAELRWALPHGLSTSVFYDLGRVKNRDQDSPRDSMTLKGGGVSISWTDPSIGLTVQATLARRDGKNPDPTSTGRDQDGSLKKNRFWLNASYSF